MSELLKEITFLSGVGPKKAEQLNKELQIFTFEDLLYYFPYRYIDRTKFYTVGEINENLPYVQAKGIIRNFQTLGQARKQRLTADFTDQTGTIKLVWFKGVTWVKKNMKSGKEYIIFGKATRFGRNLNIAHPDVESVEDRNKQISSSLEAMYHTSEKMKTRFLNSKTIFKLQKILFPLVKNDIRETLPAFLIQNIKLMPLKDALKNIHFPENAEKLQKAQFRLKFEELFYIQLNILKYQKNRKAKFKGFKFSKVGDYFNNFYKNELPFELTNAQKRVLKEIRRDFGSEMQCNRLIQGDVGSGKTLVAVMSMLIALDNGFQTAFMAPTEILAKQHFITIQKFLKNLDVNISLLTGSTKKKDRKILHEDLQSGKNQIIVGTHALNEDVVIFKNLGLVVIDEQHRFGVVQRAKMWKKNTRPPHILVMTATPIPRTLAMTVYGDLETSVIDELPPGRKTVKTVHTYDSKRLRVFKFIREQIKAGRQIYIVYPLIEESEMFDYKDLEDGLESISRAFPPPEFAISVLHGRMKPEEKEKSMNLFKKGITQIMIATTVIEVGVDVSNASVMIIESAERFGLSQLHQLRGRVGRGAEQSYCILMTSYKLSQDSKIRIKTMVESNDGFKIAEVDMKLRGPGDIEGTQQSGIPFDLKIANFAKDVEIMEFARNKASDIIKDDPNLEKEQNHLLKTRLAKLYSKKKNWGVVS